MISQKDKNVIFIQSEYLLIVTPFRNVDCGLIEKDARLSMVVVFV